MLRSRAIQVLTSIALCIAIAGCKQHVVTTYNDGKKKEEYDLVKAKNGNKVIDGIYQSWYQSGVLKTEQHFFKGNLDGISSEWNDSGKLIVEYTYNNGQITKTVTGFEREMEKKGYLPIIAHASKRWLDFNKGIHNIKAYKNISEGKMCILFDYTKPSPNIFLDWNYPRYVAPKALIRLFDKNGEHLDHFYSRERFVLSSDKNSDLFKSLQKTAQSSIECWKMKDKWHDRLIEFTCLEEKGNSFCYPINQRDLEFISIVEFALCWDYNTCYQLEGYFWY
jgi:hypothetical protein